MIKAPSRSGLLTGLTDILAQYDLDVFKASVDNTNGTSVNKFLVCNTDGGKVDNEELLSTLQHALESAVSSQSTGLKRPKLKNADKSVAEDKKNFLYTLMGIDPALRRAVFAVVSRRLLCLWKTSSVLSLVVQIPI